MDSAAACCPGFRRVAGSRSGCSVSPSAHTRHSGRALSHGRFHDPGGSRRGYRKGDRAQFRVRRLLAPMSKRRQVSASCVRSPVQSPDVRGSERERKSRGYTAQTGQAKASGPGSALLGCIRGSSGQRDLALAVTQRRVPVRPECAGISRLTGLPSEQRADCRGLERT